MVTLLFFGAIIGVGAFMVYIKKQDDAQRFARLGAVACSVCGQEGVEERGGGSYGCGSCGYDTDTDTSPERKRLVREIQDVSIAISCLELAKQEFHESRYRTQQVKRDGHRRTSHIGPFHDRYLEGIEQAEEASRILERQVDARPGLADGLDAIASIPTPADDRNGFNVCVEEAKDGISIALSGTRTVRAEMVTAFRS